MVRLKDVLKCQSKRTRTRERKSDRDRDRDRGGRTSGKISSSSSNGRGNVRDRNSNAGLRMDRRAQTTKQRKEPLVSNNRKRKGAKIAAPPSTTATATATTTTNANKPFVSRQRQNPCRADDGESSCSSSSDEDDQIPYKMNFSQPKNGASNDDASDDDSDSDDNEGGGYESPPYCEDGSLPEKQKQRRQKEPLRPGDIVEYENTMIFAAGSKGPSTARVVATTPGAKFPLKLNTGDYLYDSVRVRRTHEFIKGELYKHAGYWKPISEFRLRNRVLMVRDANANSGNGNNVARPVEGGILGTVNQLKNFREGLHKTAVEFMRGDHDNAIDKKMAASSTNKKATAAASATADSNTSSTGNDADEDNDGEDDDDDSSSSSSSSDGSELRLEFKRLKEEREKKQKQCNNTKSTSKSSPFLLPEDTDSDDSDTVNDACNNDTCVSGKPPLGGGVPTGRLYLSSKRPGLVLKKISRTAASITTTTTKDSDSKTHNSKNENDGLRRATPFDQTKTMMKKQNHPSKTPKPIDMPIYIDSKIKERQSPENLQSSSHHSTSSSSSSSCTSTAKRKAPSTTTTKTPHSRSITMTTVASKAENVRLFEELLESHDDDDDDDDNGDDGDDDSLLLGNPIFTTLKTSGIRIVPKARNRDRNKNRTRNEKHSSARESKTNSNSKPQHHSPMEENPVDLFEDSSGDDDSSGGSICRKRNRRGERMLRSPSIDLCHRNNKRTNVDAKVDANSNANVDADGILWYTQDDHGKSKGVQDTQHHLSLSAGSSHRALKRSVVVGYRPLSFSVGKRQEDSGEDESSPPTLAKAYMKREEAKKQQQQRKREGHSRNRVTNDSASKHHDDVMSSPDRGEKKKTAQSKERHRTKALEKKNSNRCKLLKTKETPRKQRKRPPPYPKQHLNHQDRENDTIMLSSTQENEWTDCENDEPSFHHSSHEKCKATSTSSSLSSDSEPTPSKRSRKLTQKRNPTNNWNSRQKHSEHDSKPREQRNGMKQNHRHYELSSSLSSEEVHQKIPRTPWSTDCEVDSPPLSSVAVVTGKHQHSTTKDSYRASRHSSKNKPKPKPSVFDFSSHDENENPPAMVGFGTERRFSPKLLGSSKRKAFEPKITRKPKAR